MKNKNILVMLAWFLIIIFVSQTNAQWALLEEFDVSAVGISSPCSDNAPIVYSTTTLVSGRLYRIVASGTYDAAAGITSDAEYSSGPDSYAWQDFVEKYETHGEGLLELMVDGAFVEWGDYDPSHVYVLDYIGTGSSVAFHIYDICAYNNKGSLHVQIYGLADIEKEMSQDSAKLGDIITVTLTVDNPYDDPVTVVDDLGDNLKYIPDSLTVAPGPTGDVTVVDNRVSTTVPNGNHTVTFEAQVVEVKDDTIDVINIAYVFAPEVEATDPSAADDSADDTIELLPYEGLSKDILLCTEPDPLYVPWQTDVHWLLLITVENIDTDAIKTMKDIVVKDNFGGDLELDEGESKQFINPPPSDGEITKKAKGKTEKIQLTWDGFSLSDEDVAQLWLEVSTDVNPGQGNKEPGKNEYTSTGPHDLNSGATLKFIDSDGTGFQLSAHTGPLTVEAYEPIE